jgi:prepilin-type processing-associated H-X9-DG protein
MRILATGIAVFTLIAIQSGCGRKDSPNGDGSRGTTQEESASLVRSVERARSGARRARCLKNLQELAGAEATWSMEHDGKFSNRLSDLYPKYVSNLELFSCPSPDGEDITRKEDIDSKTSYILRKGLTRASPPTEVLIYERHASHEGGHNVAFLDTHVETLSASRIRRLLQTDQGR